MVKSEIHINFGLVKSWCYYLSCDGPLGLILERLRVLFILMMCDVLVLNENSVTVAILGWVSTTVNTEKMLESPAPVSVGSGEFIAPGS